MEEIEETKQLKKMQVIVGNTLRDLQTRTNSLGIQKEDIISVHCERGHWSLIFYS